MTADNSCENISAGIHAGRRADRDLTEMLGLVKGLLADGEMVEAEVNHLNFWMEGHPDVLATFPGKALSDRLERIFQDGKVDDEERQDLKLLLEELVGGSAGVIGPASSSTELPIDNPAPSIEFANKTFVLTGKFAMGPRKACEKLVQSLGGACKGNIVTSLDYLVLGTFGSRDWIQSSQGRKIEKAMKFKADGRQIYIVSESHWANAMESRFGSLKE